VLADRAYSSRAIRCHLRRRGIRAVIPKPSDQIGSGTPCINRLKQWRGLATRTDKLAIAYQAALHLAGILIWTRC
jgi:hypothetical protein